MYLPFFANCNYAAFKAESPENVSKVIEVNNMLRLKLSSKVGRVEKCPYQPEELKNLKHKFSAAKLQVTEC